MAPPALTLMLDKIAHARTRREHEMARNALLALSAGAAEPVLRELGRLHGDEATFALEDFLVSKVTAKALIGYAKDQRLPSLVRAHVVDALGRLALENDASAQEIRSALKELKIDPDPRLQRCLDDLGI